MTSRILWSKQFEHVYFKRGASEKMLADAQAELVAPLSKAELKAIVRRSQRNPFPKTDPLYAHYRPIDPTLWKLPKGPLPPSYVDFLRWSNGGAFFNGARSFDSFLECSALRREMLGHNVPEYFPGFLPFASDGYSNMYGFDMRLDPVQGEYPILFVAYSNICTKDAVFVAATFLEACTGTWDPQYAR